jgi:hypothetical protein
MTRATLFGAVITALLGLSVPAAADDPSDEAKDLRRTLSRAISANDVDADYKRFCDRHKVLMRDFSPAAQRLKLVKEPILPIAKRVADDPLFHFSEAAAMIEAFDKRQAKRDVAGMLAEMGGLANIGRIRAPRAPRVPRAGSDVDDYMDYLEEVLDDAKDEYDKAVRKLSDDQQRMIHVHAPIIMNTVIQHFYLQSAPSDAILEKCLHVLAFIDHIDRVALTRSAMLIASLTDEKFLQQMKDDLMGEKLVDNNVDGVAGTMLASRRVRDIGWIVIAGIEENHYMHNPNDRIALIVDLGGNERYENCTQTGFPLLGPTADANAIPMPEPFSVVIDLSGDDSYTGTGQQSCGAAVLGVAMLFDREGNDTYVAPSRSLGYGSFGVGMLIDRKGNDSYTSVVLTQGAAFNGLGLFYDAEGNDKMVAAAHAAGFAMPGGVGCFLDAAGNDAVSTIGSNGNPPIESMSIRGWNKYQGMGQGSALGFRYAHTTGNGGYVGGGLGLCLDFAGNDTYVSGEYGQGAGYYYGTGIYYNAKGNDSYTSEGSCNGAGVYAGQGLFVDAAGDDKYTGATTVAFGAATSAATGVFIDLAGDDTYTMDGNIAFGSATGPAWGSLSTVPAMIRSPYPGSTVAARPDPGRTPRCKRSASGSSLRSARALIATRSRTRQANHGATAPLPSTEQ